MERDPELRAIDNEYVDAVAEALRLGPRPHAVRRPEGQPSLLQRLQQPELRTLPVQQPTEPVKR